MKTKIKERVILWSGKLSSLSGWRRYIVSMLCGMATAMAFPPFNLIPVLFVSFPALILLLRKARTGGSAFLLGWCFSFGLLVPCLYWIAGALFVDLQTFWWLIPFAVAGLPALFAIYYGFASALAWRFTDLKKLGGIIIFSLLWFFADYLRGHAFTGFPWDMTGYIWGEFLPVLQSTSIFGISGLTFVTVLLACLPATLINTSEKHAEKCLHIVLMAFSAFICLTLWGSWRTLQAHNDVVPDVRLRLVQPNISQSHKWKPEDREANFQTLLDLSFAPASKAVTHIVWPETATAFYLSEDISHRLAIASMLPENTKLLTGSVQRQWLSDKQKTEYYNSLIVIDDSAHIIAGYDKFHLVPFGEYIPFRESLPFNTTAFVGADFTAGSGLQTLSIAGFPPFSPLVCYEAIFSGDVASRDAPPRALVNITNDAWYEGTIGPAQHFYIARVRAIEEGIPLVRVSNKGVVGVIDGYGRIKAKLDKDAPSFIDSDMPKPAKNNTVFSKYGDTPLLVTLLMTLLFIVIQRVTTRGWKHI